MVPHITGTIFNFVFVFLIKCINSPTYKREIKLYKKYTYSKIFNEQWLYE